MSEYSVYSRFNLNQHQKHFVNYLEVIVHPSGRVEYAVPSHQEKLLYIWAKRKGYCKSHDEWLQVRYSPSFIQLTYDTFDPWDMLSGLLNQTGCVSVWSDYVRLPSQITFQQRLTLLKLIRAEVLSKACEDTINEVEVI